MKKAFLVFLISFTMLYAQDNRGYIVEVGDKAPAFIAKTIEDDLFNLSENRGKVIMLQFTASWCSVCMKEMPFIEKEIWQKHKDNSDFVLLALAKDDERRRQGEKEIQLMIDRTDITYPIGTDYNSKIFNLFAEKKAGVTRNIIIDQNGKIVFLTRLFDYDEFDEMKNVINKLLSD